MAEIVPNRRKTTNKQLNSKDNISYLSVYLFPTLIVIKQNPI